ncbi:MAG: hypothetical protein ACTSWE_16735 [Promethearchaeota archaeon]
MIFFILFSYIISYILTRWLGGPFGKIFRMLAIIGLIIHEIIHLAACLVTFAPVREIKIIERLQNPESGKKRIQYKGYKAMDHEKLTFLQAIFISFAPLVCSYYLFCYLLTQLFQPNLPVLLFFLNLILMISIFLSAAPSAIDLLAIPCAFKANVRYSFYQLFLAALSFFTTWYLIETFQYSLIHEFFMVLIGMVLYYCWKYSIKSLYHVIRIFTIHYHKIARIKSRSRFS